MSTEHRPNRDATTVEGFSREWTSFDYSAHSPEELEDMFEQYFGIFPWTSVPSNAVGFDLGCGTGRWARFVADRVGTLHCIDASGEALSVARRNLGDKINCEFHHASVDEIPLPDSSMDFGYSVGVLHHVPDTAAGLAACVQKLKPGAPFLVYLYYALDNRPRWFRTVWRASDVLRRGVSSFPYPARYACSQLLAAGVYWPLARTARALESRGFDVSSVPLSAYRNRSFYVMRTDALDRFGTRLEQRFTRQEIVQLMRSAGLDGITIAEQTPYWVAVGYRT